MLCPIYTFSFQLQESNKKLIKDVKSKDTHIYSLMEQNKELKKINSCENLDEVYLLKSKLEEVKGHLEARDEDYRVYKTSCFWILDYQLYLTLEFIEEAGYS